MKGSMRGFISVEDLDEDAIYLLADHAAVALGAETAVAFVSKYVGTTKVFTGINN